MKEALAYKEVFEMSPIALVEWASEEFAVDQLEKVSTADDMEAASILMTRIAYSQVYLNELLAYAKILVRESKRKGTKEEWEDMVDRKEVLERFLKALDDVRTALSRAVTVKIQNDKELYMNTSGTY